MWPFPSSFCLLHHCVCLPISQSLRGGCVTGSLSDHSGSELFQSGWDTCWDLPASCLSLSLSLSASCSWSCCLTHASWIHSHAQTQKSRDSLRHTGSGSILNHNQIRFKISSLLLWHAADRVDKVEFELSFSDLFSSRSLFPPVDWRWTCVRQGVRETEEEGSGWSLHSYYLITSPNSKMTRSKRWVLSVPWCRYEHDGLESRKGRRGLEEKEGL